ncbi:hypothetical protein ACROYT_G014305 [Oculina patagonica]
MVLLIAKGDDRFQNADEAKRRAFFLDFLVNITDFLLQLRSLFGFLAKLFSNNIPLKISGRYIPFFRFGLVDSCKCRCQIKFDCLIYEMFFIKELKPTLNKQCDSIRAKLFV